MGEDRCLNETRRTVLAPLPSFVALTASTHVACFGEHSPAFLDDHRSPALLRRLQAIPPGRWTQSVEGRGERSEMRRSVMRLFLSFVACRPFRFSLALMALAMQVRNHRREGPLFPGRSPAERLFRNALPRSSLAPTAQRYCRGNPQSRAKNWLKNLTTKEEIECIVVDVNSGHTDIPEVGAGFAEPCPYFWRVSFPPADWSPRSPEAKRLASSTGQPKPAETKKTRLTRCGISGALLVWRPYPSRHRTLVSKLKRLCYRFEG